VKSRFDEEGGSSHLFKSGNFIGDVRAVTFQPRDGLYLLFVAVRSEPAEFGPVWFIPSHHFSAHAQRLSEGKILRMSASAKESIAGSVASVPLGERAARPRDPGRPRPPLISLGASQTRWPVKRRCTSRSAPQAPGTVLRRALVVSRTSLMHDVRAPPERRFRMRRDVFQNACAT
jgi:hypothetical protein